MSEAPRIELVTPKLSALDKLRQASGDLDKLRDLLLNSVDIFPKILTSGTTSIWYALPNGGKTLYAMRSVIDAIEAKRVDGNYVFYINEDDNLPGFIEKSEIAQRVGFNMISSVQSRTEDIRSAQDILRILSEIAESPECGKVLIIIDTLKKFVSVMSKDLVPHFFSLMRKLNAGGATILILAHANKRNNPDAPLIPAGVQDVADDIDIMYALDGLSDRDDFIQRVEMRCTKDRGPVEQVICWEYKKSDLYSYPEMLESITRTNQDVIDAARVQRIKQHSLEKYRDENSFLEALLAGKPEMMQSEILQALKDPEQNPNAVGASRVRQAITALNGVSVTVRKDRHRNNAKMVSWRGGVSQT